MKKVLTLITVSLLISCATDTETKTNKTDISTLNSETAQSSTTEVSNISILKAREEHLSNLYDSSLDSIVHIKVIQTIPSRGFFMQNQSRRSNGSGFVWDEIGHIITNYHVVANVDNVEVQFSDGSEFLAKVVGLDPNSDLAVIKIDTKDREFKPLNIGNSNKVDVGNLTLAIGSPFGQEFSMTSGIVSAVKRTVPSQNSTFTIPNVIQTDAAINPGNSGGPLLNIDGSVIGINSQIITQGGINAGIGFAVPINTAKAIVPTLIKGEKFLYPWIGISGMSLSKNHKKALNLSEDINGVMIVDIAIDGAAEKSNLKGYQETVSDDYNSYPSGGDIIMSINEVPITSMNELSSVLFENHSPGEIIVLDIIRDTENITVELELQPRPQ
ncbi:MAG: trypsin [Chloroflexi bacterium]|nr:trypsin [Chloroflexota bacterium]|tara:strand:- start:342 stop:1496 length:1155 start_codon:yes stop_codon:yes gene_type:complete